MINRISLLCFVSLLCAVNSASSQLFPTYVNGTFSLGNATGPSPYALADTFFLASNPTASKTIYLDYRGYHSVGNRWGHDIVFDPFSLDADVLNFSDEELIRIQQHFQNTAEDFLPFDVNVTTTDPGMAKLRRSSTSDTEYGIRSLNTQAKNGFGNGIGGVAYLNSFNAIRPNDTQDTPVFTFNKGFNAGAQTNSHEVGHALGLRHDGLLPNTTYHPGVGSGPTGWGPIMGAPFSKNLSQWSKGEYVDANNLEDDYAIMTKEANGFDFRADDYGNSLATASNLTHVNGLVDQWGIIERQTDLDYFSFTAASGMLNLQIDPFKGTPNLDIEARLYDAAGSLLFTSNPLEDVNAPMSFLLTGGDYFLAIDGVGKPGVYTDYGSLGFYYLQGSFDVVPEPGSAALVGLIGVAIVLIRRRTRA